MQKDVLKRCLELAREIYWSCQDPRHVDYCADELISLLKLLQQEPAPELCETVVSD